MSNQPVWSSASPKQCVFTVRNARKEDAQEIVSIGSTVFAASFGHSLPSKDLEAYLGQAYTPAAIARELADPQKMFCVACDGRDRVVGFAQLTMGTSEDCIRDFGKPIELGRLYVHQDFHGLGVGKALVSEVETRARDWGFKTMWLGVWEENFKAQKVYQRLGFSKAGDHEFRMGSTVQTDWILTKAL